MLKAESFEGSARFCKPIGGKLCNGMCSLWGLWAAVLGQSGGTGLYTVYINIFQLKYILKTLSHSGKIKACLRHVRWTRTCTRSENN